MIINLNIVFYIMISNIPKYRVNEIIKLYEASKYTLGTNSSMRRRIFLSTLRLYYPWENRETIQYMFDTIIKSSEIEYMIKLRSKNIKQEYGKIVKKLFFVMDANNDGGIDLNEFKYALINISNLIPNPEILFSTADTNGDGILDINEFYRLVASTPELRNNFDIIIENAVSENQQKEYECQARIFKNDITGRRPSLSDIRTPENICEIDIPLYGVSLSPSACAIARRR